MGISSSKGYPVYFVRGPVTKDPTIQGSMCTSARDVVLKLAQAVNHDRTLLSVLLSPTIEIIDPST